MASREVLRIRIALRNRMNGWISVNGYAVAASDRSPLVCVHRQNAYLSWTCSQFQHSAIGIPSAVPQGTV